MVEISRCSSVQIEDKKTLRSVWRAERKQQPQGLNHAVHDEDAGELAEEAGDVRLNRQRFEVDDAKQELPVEDAEMERQCA